ncbi:hypothetical protein GYH30_027308 [Glycine max]|uniref:Uncharacterized protein n=1 Tax=Glycine max TaxID=3847 RepID=A0A0R0HZ39_SOYBN|nr:hypothetical protein GYH30_027308 [Glycine max]
MKPCPMTFLSNLKLFSLHRHRIPPAEFVACCASQLTSESPHKAWHMDLFITSFFVSCKHIISIFCLLTSLLIAGHLSPLPNPLTLNVIIFIVKLSCIPICVLLLDLLSPCPLFLLQDPLAKTHW